jgi:hypothetical protein
MISDVLLRALLMKSLIFFCNDFWFPFSPSVTAHRSNVPEFTRFWGADAAATDCFLFFFFAGINAPTSQSLLNYILLALVYGGVLIYRRQPLTVMSYVTVPPARPQLH